MRRFRCVKIFVGKGIEGRRYHQLVHWQDERSSRHKQCQCVALAISYGQWIRPQLIIDVPGVLSEGFQKVFEGAAARVFQIRVFFGVK